MEISQKNLLIKWKDILAQYLNPISIVDELHEFFPLHSRQRNQVLAKEEQPHVAVDIMINVLMESEMAGAYPRLLEAVKTQHPWLIPFITGEIEEECLPGGTSKIQFQEYVYKLLTIFVPTLAENIQATEVSADMKAKEFLNQEEEERVNAKAINSGNTAAVRTLFSILVRKPIEWLQAFKSTIRDQNYNNVDMVNDIPDSIEEFSELSISIDSNKKQYSYIPSTSLHSENSTSSTQAFIEPCNNVDNGLEVFVHPASVHYQSESYMRYSYKNPESTTLGAAANPHQSLYGDLHGTTQQESAEYPPPNNIIPVEAFYVPGKLKSNSSVNKKKCDNAIKRQPSLSAAVGNNAIILTDERLEVAWNIITSRFPHILDSTNRRIGFLVPKITKSYDSLRKIFDSPQWSVAFYGPEPCKELRALMHQSQVIVMSAESFLAWLMEDSDVGKIGEFDVLIFDQCFQSHDKGPYKEVLLKYLSTRKNDPGRIQTQVIGLANSISSVRLSTLNQADCVILNLVALFDARAGIDLDLEGANKTKKILSTSSKRSGSKKNEISDPLMHYLCVNMDYIVDLIYKLPPIRQLQDVKHPRKIGKGTLEYRKWCDDVSEKISDLSDSSDNHNYLVTCCVKFLRTFNEGFIIKANCRTVDAVHFLSQQLEAIKPGSDQESPTVVKRLIKIVNEAEEKLPLFPSMDGVEDSSSLDKIEHYLLSQCRQKQLSHILLVVGARVTVEYLKTWMGDKVLPKLSMTQRKAKIRTGNRPTVEICFCDELPRNMQQFDLTLCYDCQIGSNKSKQLVQVESDHVLVNDKVKFTKSLLIKKAIESMQELCKNEPTAYLNLMWKHQEKLLAGQSM